MFASWSLSEFHYGQLAGEQWDWMRSWCKGQNCALVTPEWGYLWVCARATPEGRLPVNMCPCHTRRETPFEHVSLPHWNGCCQWAVPTVAPGQWEIPPCSLTSTCHTHLTATSMFLNKFLIKESWNKMWSEVSLAPMHYSLLFAMSRF